LLCVVFKVPPDIAELTDINRVLSQFTFSASETGFCFSVSGNMRTITTDTTPTGNVTISASRSTSRCGVLVWTDYEYDPMAAFKARWLTYFRGCMQKRNRHLVDK